MRTIAYTNETIEKKLSRKVEYKNEGGKVFAIYSFSGKAYTEEVIPAEVTRKFNNGTYEYYLNGKLIKRNKTAFDFAIATSRDIVKLGHTTDGFASFVTKWFYATAQFVDVKEA